ncbi:MAG: DUF4286 domain-containing protein [Acidobacteriota bacterium]|nr:DUF4286 domain-containing protein [Acidobacteriota bacterium]
MTSSSPQTEPSPETHPAEPQIASTVECTFTDPKVAWRWLDWLQGGHLADVCAAGALAADAVLLDGEPVRCQARYRFSHRAAFEAYERDHAPRLRAEGLELFPLELGLSYSRTLGEIRSTHH